MKHRLRYIILILAIFLPLAAGIILPQHAAAGPNDEAPPSQHAIKTGKFTWWDRNTIHADINGKTYYFRPHNVEPGIGQSNYLAYDVGNSSCWGRITFNDHYPFNVVGGPNWTTDYFTPGEVSPQTINVDMDWKDPHAHNARCQNTSPNQIKNVPIGNTGPSGNFDVYFTVDSGGRSITSVGGGRTYTQTQDSQHTNLFYRNSESGSTCQDALQVDKSAGTYKSYELTSGGSGVSPPASINADSSCNLITGSGFVEMDISQLLGNAQALQDTPNPSGGGSASGSNQLDCPVFTLNSPLNWIICPVVQGLVWVVGQLDSLITDQLTVPTNNIFCDSGSMSDSCSAYYAAWRSFRNLALGLLVIVGLVIVISQALGAEILDAYTVRKALPRLLVAIVGITLSWPLMKFLIVLSNDLGFGVRGLILAPFHLLNSQVNFNFSPNWFANFSLGAVGAAGATVWLATGGLFTLLAYAGTAALAVLIAILVLMLRQVAIIVLMILAPVAIVAYILPNTNRVYKLWWESFSKALLMFPLIVAFIAAGRVFASVAANSGDTMTGLIGSIAYFAPYFMIPLTFRMAGQTMGSLGNFVNSRGEGARGFLQKKRQETRARRTQRARAGKLWREGWGTFGGRLGVDKNGRPRSISRYANRAMMWGTDLDEMVPATIGARGGRVGKGLFGNYAARAQDLIGQETMAHITKAAQAAGANGPLHHKAERALAGTWGHPNEGGFSAGLQDRLRTAGFEDGHSPETASQMQHMAQVMREHGNTDEVSAASDLEHMAGFMGNVNKDPEMYRAGGNVQAVGALLLANSGRLGPAEQAQVLERVRTAGPHGDSLASRLEKQTSAASRQRVEMRHGKGVYQDAGGAYHSSFDVTSPEVYAKAKDNLLTAKMPELMASKGETVETYAPVWDSMLRPGPANGTEWSNEQETARAQLFQLASQYSSSDPDAKAKALGVLDRIGLRDEFNQREQRYNPNIATGAGQPPQPPPAQPGGQPGGQQPQPSDRRLKRNVSYVAATADGINLYRFQYLWSDQVYVGVMAQELVDTHPEALVIGADGFYRVDYLVLGLRMLTIEEWAVNKAPGKATGLLR